jgi:hypothetical protein
MHKIATILMLFLLVSSLTAQIDRVYDPALETVNPDSLTDQDTLINKNGFFSIFKGKPGKAALYSLVLPGGGQIYNKKWLKVPLAMGLDGFTIYYVYSTNKLYNQAQQLYLTALREGGNVSRTKAVRDIYRKRREYSWVWFAVGHLLTVIDAYVDRHLMGFDISDNLSLYQYPDKNDFPVYNVMSISYKFNQTTPKSDPVVFP